jgi:hypothetical protein
LYLITTVHCHLSFHRTHSLLMPILTAIYFTMTGDPGLETGVLTFMHFNDICTHLMTCQCFLCFILFSVLFSVSFVPGEVSVRPCTVLRVTRTVVYVESLDNPSSYFPGLLYSSVVYASRILLEVIIYELDEICDSSQRCL